MEMSSPSMSGSDPLASSVQKVSFVVLGAEHTGKTTLVEHFVQAEGLTDENCVNNASAVAGGSFDLCDKKLLTHKQGAANYHRILSVGEITYECSVWDTSSHSKFRSLLPLYYRSVDAAVLLVDVQDGSEKSLKWAQTILSSIKEKTPPYVICLVATKASNTQDVSHIKEEIRCYARFEDILFMELSDPSSPTHLFSTLCSAVRKKRSELWVNNSSVTNDGRVSPAASNTSPVRSRSPILRQGSATPNTQTRGGGSSRVPRERRPHWIADSAVKKCHLCGISFGLMTRKHHCRRCGNVFCSSCTARSRRLPELGFNTPVRVCDRCYGL